MKATKKLAAIASVLVLASALTGCSNAIEYKTFYYENSNDSSSGETPKDDSSQGDSSQENSSSDIPDIGDLPLDDGQSIANQIVAEADDEYFSKVAFVGEALCSGLGFYVTEIDEQQVYTENNAHISDILDTKWSVDGVSLPLADALYATDRKYIYIWIGPNDLGNYTPAGFADKYKEVIESLFYANPMAYVGVVSVAPVSAAYEQTLEKGKIDDYNTKLAEMIDNIGNNRVFFFNITATIGDSNGNLKSDYDSGDGLHMTGPAYKAIAQYLFDNQIHPYLADFELLGSGDSEAGDGEEGSEDKPETDAAQPQPDTEGANANADGDSPATE